MDLLDSHSGLNLHDPGWRIFSSNRQLPPQMVTETGELQEVFVNEGCVIEGKAEKSIIFQGVHIEEGASIYECVVMNSVVIGSGAKLARTIIPPDLVIPENFEIGNPEGDIILLTEEMISEWKESAGV